METYYYLKKKNNKNDAFNEVPMFKQNCCHNDTQKKN